MNDEFALVRQNDLISAVQNAIKTALDGYASATSPQQNHVEDEILTQQQARELLHISEATIIQWRKAGRVPYRKIGKRVYYSKKELLGLV